MVKYIKIASFCNFNRKLFKTDVMEQFENQNCINKKKTTGKD